MYRSPDISIVIPFLNERDTLAELHRQAGDALDAIGRSWEILFVDDGSTDDGAAVVAELMRADNRVGLIQFRRNFGKAAALTAGLTHARGAIIVTMDADLQDDPAEIPALLAKLAEGWDAVSGWKSVRHDPLDKVISSKLFNGAVSRLSGLTLHDFNCGLKAYRAEAIKGLDLFGEMHRFIPVLLHSRGFRITEIEVQHHPRRFGKSKYGFSRAFKGMLDLVTVLLSTKYNFRPLHLFGAIGMMLSSLGMLALGYLSLIWVLGYGPIGTRPLLFLGLLLVIAGIQFTSTGLVAEMLIRRRPTDAAPYFTRAVELPSDGPRARREDHKARPKLELTH